MVLSGSTCVTKDLAVAPSVEFQKLNNVIYGLESRFVHGSEVRNALYRARIEIGRAEALNRRNKDCPEHEWIYIKSGETNG